MDIFPIKGMCMQKFKRECLPNGQMTTSVMTMTIQHMTVLRNTDSKWVAWSQGCPLCPGHHHFWISCDHEALKIHCLSSPYKIRWDPDFSKISTQKSGFSLNAMEVCPSYRVAIGHCSVGSFWLWCCVRWEIPQSLVILNNNIRSYNSAILAKAKTIWWPFNSQAVKNYRTKCGLLFGQFYDVSQKGIGGYPFIMCLPHHQHDLVMTTDKGMEPHIWHSHK